jgi:alkane 1-monooxygenase
MERIIQFYKTADFKYLLAYFAPIAAAFGLYAGGFASFGVVYIAFVFIPLFEQFIPISKENWAEETEEVRTGFVLFDLLLYSHVPMLYGLMFWGFWKVSNQTLTPLEWVGIVANLGVMAGGFGINVAHELGHRTKKFEQNLAKLLLLPSLYQHFFIEHNLGHHKNVATDADPATSRFGENLYAFWLRSVVGCYKNAWKIENNRLTREGKSVVSWQNSMVRFAVYQLAYLLGIALFFSVSAFVLAILAAVVGLLLLETVNYIEHYGLRRKQLASGRYEPVQPHHSWNSGHSLGRIFLYELTRHSDHHYKATRKYQVLRHFSESPQLPFGYPLSMLTSLVPPLWFKIMNNRVPKTQD